MATTVCLIKCNHCNKQFKSPIQFGSAKAFFGSSLADNIVTCPECREETSCNKENLYFNDGEGGIEHGAETIPE